MKLTSETMTVKLTSETFVQPGATSGSPHKATNLRQEGGKLVASKSLVPEEG